MTIVWGLMINFTVIIDFNFAFQTPKLNTNYFESYATLIDDIMNCVFVFSMHSKKIHIKTDFLKLCHIMYVILLHLCIVSDTNKLTYDSIHLCW